FVTPKHLVKEDGNGAKVDEKMDFKVIEFSKSAKKIILSHSRVFEDEKKGEEIAERKKNTATKNKAVKKIKSNLEKTTLGDISELASLKNEMEQEQKKEIAEKKAEMDAKEEAKKVDTKKEETKPAKPKAKPKAKKEEKVEEAKEAKKEKVKEAKPKAKKKADDKSEEEVAE
ncbi:30S ribosomal protein S1, partial [Bacteroidota bacterium]